MFEKFLQILAVTCRHRNTSMPFASDNSSTYSRISDWEPIEPGGHYIVCLDCGRQFEYDWTTMQVVRTVR